MKKYKIKNPFKLTQASVDFNADMMPKNRKEVFFDVVKLHWREFLLYGLLVFAFTLPINLLIWFSDIRELILMQGFDSLSPENQMEIRAELMGLSNAVALWRIPCLLIFAVFLSGLLRVIRQFAWMENVYFKTELFDGIKQNIKQTALIMLVFGISSYITTLINNFAVAYSGNAEIVFMLVPMALLLLFIIPICSYALVASVIYSGLFFSHIKVGIVLLSKNPLKTYIAYILCALPYILCLIPNLVFHLIGSIIGSFATPFILLVWMLFSLDMLDKDINPEYFPALVGRGINAESDEE